MILETDRLLFELPAARLTGLAAYAGEVRGPADRRTAPARPAEHDLDVRRTACRTAGRRAPARDVAGRARLRRAGTPPRARRCARRARRCARSLLDRDARSRRQRRARARRRSGRVLHAGRRRAPGRRRAATWRVPWTCAAELVALLETRGDRVRAARTPTASSGSSTRRAPARAAGARWRPAGTATRRSATAATRRVTANFDLTGYLGYGGEHDRSRHHFATGHVGLNVADLDRSIDFYARVFGWDRQGPRGRLRLPRRRRPARAHALAAEQRRVRDRPARAAPPLLPGRQRSTTCRAAEARVRELGLKLYHDGIVPHGEGASSGGIFFEDPDGIRLEIFTGTGADAHQRAPRAPPRPAGSSRPWLARGRARRPGARGRHRPRRPAARDAGARHPAGRARSSSPSSRGSCSAPPDADGRMWASPLYGAPGFVTTPDDATVHIAAQPLAGRPARRRAQRRRRRRSPSSRPRAGGCGSTARRPADADGVTIALEQVYSNCPKYIATRHVDAVAPTTRRSRCAPAARRAGARVARGRGHGVRRHPRPGRPDVSHRGGRPGLPADVRRAHDRVARLLRQHAVQHARQPRRRPRVRAHRRRPGGRHDAVPVTGHATVADDRRVTLKPDRAVPRSTNAAPLSWWLEKLGPLPEQRLKLPAHGRPQPLDVLLLGQQHAQPQPVERGDHQPDVESAASASARARARRARAARAPTRGAPRARPGEPSSSICRR